MSPGLIDDEQPENKKNKKMWIDSRDYIVPMWYQLSCRPYPIPVLM